MGRLLRTYTLTELQEFVREAQEIHAVWRTESWVDSELYDGAQWSAEDEKKAKDAGIDPLTINRIFPTVNLLLGLQIVNRYDITVKGRTQKDTGLAQTMSEGIAYIHDQCEGDFLISQAYRDQIIPGIGFLMVNHNLDPRKETVQVVYRDWKEMWWDPYASPWLDPTQCRYVFQQRWMDIEELILRCPDKEAELQEYAAQFPAGGKQPYTSIWYDEAQQVEDFKHLWGGRWNRRRRVRPVEMWYPVPERGYWATYANGDAMEVLPDSMPPEQVYQMVSQAQEVVLTTVLKMRTALFLDNILLWDRPTPFNHDEYPYVPFIGYLDRFGFPYGVPRQPRGQQEEINKRRSMMLALLQKRRVIMDDSAAEKPEEMRGLYEQANRLDGFMVVKRNARFEIIEGTEKNLMQAQIELYHESERELKDITGAGTELSGQKSQAHSGVAQGQRMEQQATIIAP